ncbi:MAG: hypothetical protein Q9216_003626 [Gyalolechia sp. 2 TL-2023]
MKLIPSPSLPFGRRDAYQPGDASAYLKLRKLHCIREGVDSPGPDDPLCSLCKEVLLGEPLIDGDGLETEHRIALYELPCGHLRCCSCALKWLDTAGVFHHVCHSCDSQKLDIKPDLSELLDSTDTSAGPDLSWIEGFPNRKRPKSPSSIKYRPIYLPTIEEIGEYDDADAAEEIDISTLALQTPAKKRKLIHETLQVSPDREIPESLSPDQFQWTPVAPLEGDNGSAPEAGFNIDEKTPNTPTGLESPERRSTMRKKELRLHRWDCQGGRTCDCHIHDFDHGEDAPNYEEFVEEEKRIRKKPRYAF